MKPKMISSAVRTILMDIFMLLLCAVFFGFLLIAPLACAEEALTPEEEILWQAYQSGELIRLHVVANSDSAADQQLKLKVRDALIAAFGRTLVGHETADQAFAALGQQQAAMEAAAKECAAENGFLGAVSAQVGQLDLPEKRYGRVTLPAGTYRGLKVTLGEGKGQNWWCVLFPQLCLALSDDEADENQDADPQDVEIVWDTQQIFDCWLLCAPD